ncbi:MAG: hypothetical protein ACRDLA_02200, partial [Thermoleophilaceae bacterium]
GGYHHHLGLNTWRGEGVPPMPDGVVGMRHWTLLLEDDAQVAEVGDRLERAGFTAVAEDGGLAASDPWGNRVRIVAA